MADNTIFVGATAEGEREELNLRRANRHGLIAGATGTGKTVTLQGLAEGFSHAGVPVFVSDVKGDLAGIAMAGSPMAPSFAPFKARAAEIGMSDWAQADNPVIFWDLFGQAGHPVRTTISEMGPLLLARLMGLNDTQEGVLQLVFKAADEQGMLLLDLPDLQAMLAWAAENAADLSAKYGNVTRATVGTIQRQLLQLEAQGGDNFFGEPALDIHDMMTLAEDGRGTISVLAADKLMAAPKLYATFLLWLLSELFEVLPEVGDPDKPKLVFFFDEAHLLFDDAAPALLDKIEQVVRLIRSKGVGVYFVTQNPIDVPDDVAGQLGNRIQHKLNAFTPREQKAVAAAAQTFRASPGVDVRPRLPSSRWRGAGVAAAIDGSPAPVARTLIRPPFARVGPLTDKERAILISTSPLAGKYDTPVNRESGRDAVRQGGRCQGRDGEGAGGGGRRQGAGRSGEGRRGAGQARRGRAGARGQGRRRAPPTCRPRRRRARRRRRHARRHDLRSATRCSNRRRDRSRPRWGGRCGADRRAARARAARGLFKGR